MHKREDLVYIVPDVLFDDGNQIRQLFEVDFLSLRLSHSNHAKESREDLNISITTKGAREALLEEERKRIVTAEFGR